MTDTKLPKTLDGLQGAYEPQNVESDWYAWWNDQGFFHADENSDKPPYCIVIPPPNVTGSLHIGHALTMTIQDVLIRHKRMSGFEALWLPGTDHAGISTQVMVERQLRSEGLTRYDLGREKFLERTWEWKAKYGGRITEQLRYLGTSLDWERERFTMDEGLSNAVLEVFISLYNEGLIYRAERLVNWDPVSQTVLSDLEVDAEPEQGNLWHIRYPLSDDPSKGIIVATTRPETLLGDSAVAVHPDDPRYADLIGKTVALPLTGRHIPIIADGEVADPEFGSGAVKITPAHDFNDWECGKRNDLPILQVIGFDAKINANAPERYQGMERFEARKQIVKDLDAGGFLIKTEPHSYMPGRSQRTGVIVEPLPMLQWFVDMKPLAEPAIKAVEDGDINFVPASWSKVYFEWMYNIRDWCISRQLWWGHRIPAWYGPDGEVFVARSEAEAQEAAKTHYKSDEDIALKQDEDVLDTWFSSGLWPFSTMGWPEQTETLAKFYPTSVMETGFDIIFFWVARMIVFGLHFMKEVPFHTVFLHAMVRDRYGDKMSKTKGNVVDPLHLIHGVTPASIPSSERHHYKMLLEEYSEGLSPQGADALRFTLAVLAAQGRDIKLDLKRVNGYRAFLNKLWNASKFALMHLKDWTPTALDPATAPLTPADRWILGRLQHATRTVSEALENFKLNEAAQTLYNFIWKELCDWYLEASKPVLYASDAARDLGGDPDTNRAVLSHVFDQTLRLLHPFCPFITEEIWQTLPHTDTTASLCIADWPEADAALDFAEETQAMELAIELISAIRTIRGETGVKPSVTIDNVILLTDDAKTRAAIDQTRTYLRTLAKADTFTVAALDDANRPSKTATAVTSGVEIHIPLAGLIDIEEETARLHKELAKTAKDIEHVTRKLDNPRFVAKAPDHIVAKERAKHEEFLARKAALEASLAELEALG